MADVRFELTTRYPMHVLLPTSPFVKVVVRWAEGDRLTNRLPNLSLITEIARQAAVGESLQDAVEQHSAFIHFTLPSLETLMLKVTVSPTAEF